MLRFDDVAVDQEIPALRKSISLVDMVKYGSATWDFLRIHYDSEHMKARGYNGPIVDGQMLGAFLAQMVVDWAGDPEMLKKLKFRNRQITYPGTVITCRGRVARKEERDGENLVVCDLWAENDKGELVAGPAEAVLTFPK